MSPAHQLAAQEAAADRAARRRELIAFRRGSSVRRAQDEALERAGASARIVLEGSNETLDAGAGRPRASAPPSCRASSPSCPGPPLWRSGRCARRSACPSC